MAPTVLERGLRIGDFAAVGDGAGDDCAGAGDLGVVGLQDAEEEEGGGAG